LDLARPALCTEGGCAEYCDEEGRWNSQYFSTAQAALCSALHALVLQRHGVHIRLFPALPPGWDQCAFTGFQAAGLNLDANYSRGVAEVEVRNPSDRARSAVFRLGKACVAVRLDPGTHQRLVLEAQGD
jgi:hypothetical protein